MGQLRVGALILVCELGRLLPDLTLRSAKEGGRGIFVDLSATNWKSKVGGMGAFK